jgi:hypothetical protein
MLEKTGYYWRTNTISPFVAEWQWRFEQCTGGAITKELAVADLLSLGAGHFSDVTTQGGGDEFTHSESN